jgi:endo-1,3-1,4-beta-glycanase ExoK
MSLPGGSRSSEFYWFDKFGAVNNSRWFFAGPWWNGDPFGSGFDPKKYVISNNVLTLLADAKPFPLNDGTGVVLNYTSSEIRTWQYHGFGCYSVCMKPSPISGVSSSFYAYAGKYDDPDNRGPFGNPPGLGKRKCSS